MMSGCQPEEDEAVIGRSGNLRSSAEEQARSLFLQFLLRRFQGHDPDFAALLRDHPTLGRQLHDIRAQFEPLLQEHFRDEVPDDFAAHLESIAVSDAAVSDAAPAAPNSANPSSATPNSSAATTPGADGDTAGGAHESHAEQAATLSGWERYEQLEEIARGGMGIVWHAWDRLLDRPLAMKVISVDHRSPIERERWVRRFLREAAITAQLDHPGIVPVHEVGRDPSGRVFFTMRLVRGSDLHEILQPPDQSACTWTRLDVLGVLLKVCETIEYAHSRGIVHRDLKPANIMVGSYGEAYVMDWGLARILDDAPLTSEIINQLAVIDEACANELDATPRVDPAGDDHAAHLNDARPPLQTGAGTLLGTPVYMAPEQARGDLEEIGPWTDVYAIGAMLYTLLVGHPPHLEPGANRSAQEIVDRIRAGTTCDFPDHTNAPMRLTQICQEAMRQDPATRLRSVAELRKQLRSYFEAAQQSEEEAQRARVAAARDQRVAQFMIELFEVADPTEALGETLSARDLIDRGAGKIEQQLKDQPIVQARLFHAIGDIYLKMGHYEPARHMLTLAIELRREHLGAQHAAVAESSITLGQIFVADGDFDSADTWLERAHEIITRNRGDDDMAALLPRVIQQQAIVGHERGQLGAAEEKFRTALHLFAELQEDRPQDRAECIGNLAWLLQTCGRYDEAERLHQQALEMCEQQHGPEHPSIAMHKNRLASLCQNTARYDEAESLYREVLQTRTKVLGEQHPLVAVSLNNLAVLLRLRGDYDGGEDLYRQALAIYEARLGENHPKTAIALSNLALLLTRKNQLDESDALHERSLLACYKTFGEEHVAIAANLSNLARNQLLRGRLTEANDYNVAAEQQFRALLGNEHPYVARCLLDRAAIQLELHHTDAAAIAADEAMAIQTAKLAPDHIDLAHTETQLAQIARAQGDLPRARHHADAALRRFSEALPVNDPGLARPQALVDELANAPSHDVDDDPTGATQ